MIKYNGDHKGVNRAVKLANKLLSNNNFYVRIGDGEQYDMSNIPNRKVAYFIKYIYFKHNVEVKLYKPWWYFSRAIAMFKYSEPFTIYLNARKLQRSDESILGSIAHELVHLVDHKIEDASFGHGNNYRYGKEYTAPYFIGTLAKRFYEK